MFTFIVRSFSLKYKMHTFIIYINANSGGFLKMALVRAFYCRIRGVSENLDIFMSIIRLKFVETSQTTIIDE